MALRSNDPYATFDAIEPTSGFFRRVQQVELEELNPDDIAEDLSDDLMANLVASNDEIPVHLEAVFDEESLSMRDRDALNAATEVSEISEIVERPSSRRNAPPPLPKAANQTARQYFSFESILWRVK